jgi:hypothetical protein
MARYRNAEATLFNVVEFNNINPDFNRMKFHTVKNVDLK